MIEFKTGNPLIYIKYDEENVDILKGATLLDPKTVINEIHEQSSDLSYAPDRTWDDMVLTYQWGAGIKFGENTGGGDLLIIEPNWITKDDQALIECGIEWGSHWTVEADLYEETRDREKLFTEAINKINELISSI